MIVAVVIAIEAIANKPEKISGLNRIQTHGLCVSAAVRVPYIWALKTHTLRAGQYVEFIACQYQLFPPCVVYVVYKL